MPTHTLPARSRWALIDVVRGVAILAMIVYHLGWDLSYYGIIATDVTTEPGWVVLQRAILSSFLALVGVGLVLGHGNGIRWPAFWRRFGILVAAALAVTLGTWWMFPDYFVYFGILHAIAAFSLAALPFLRLPVWVLLAVAGLFLLAPQFVGAPQFSARHLAWIGFWTTLPETTDIVPFFPWFSVVLLGMAGTKMLLAAPAAAPFAAWPGRGKLARALAWCGRLSLVIYLVHQPLLLGVIMLASQLQPAILQPEVLSRADSFAASCRSSCAASGNGASYCESYCGCALEQVESADLWDVIDRAGTDPAVASIAKLCEALAE